MKAILSIIFSIVVLFSCGNVKQEYQQERAQSKVVTQKTIQELERDRQVTLSDQLEDRIAVPEGYKRTSLKSKSFGTYLRQLTLKPVGSVVKYYDGSVKSNYGTYVGVVDLPIGNEDLHQCADAIMRLRAEYLWKIEDYDKIQFNFTNGHQVKYVEWMQGNRMKVDGNRTQWVKKAEPSNTDQDLWDYLQLIFMYAGTASLEKEMRAISLSEARIGDVLIQGGFPGHAVIIVDEAINEKTGEKVFLLAQSFMPAQEIQILANLTEGDLSPWYHLDQDRIFTAEWEFSSSALRRFVD